MNNDNFHKKKKKNEHKNNTIDTCATSKINIDELKRKIFVFLFVKTKVETNRGKKIS